MSSTTGGRGDAFKAEAEKILASKSAFSITSVFGLGGGKAQKLEEASEIFVKAGNAYKLANLWQSAGEMFTKAAESLAEASNESKSDVASKYSEAGKCYKKINPELAVLAMQKAVNEFNDMGRFGASARLMQEMAEIFEADNNIEMAVQSYQQAKDLFSMDSKKSNANQCMVKVANLSSGSDSTADQLIVAADIYEELGVESLQSNLGKYSAKGHFFSCNLCHLAAGDLVMVENKIAFSKDKDFSFASSRECEFLEKLVEASNNQDGEAFSTACADFDRITPLDPWKTSLLLKSKKFIADAENDEPDLS